MARKLANGAIVDDTGQWYWNLKGWSTLAAVPTGKAPGALFGKDRRDVAHLMHGTLVNVNAMTAIRVAGEEAARLVKELGSLEAAEAAISPDIRLPLSQPELAAAPSAITPAAATSPDRFAQLKVIGELREQGILTEDEFRKEKAKILGTG